MLDIVTILLMKCRSVNMFYCDACAEKRKWPKTWFKSEGQCEVCGNFANCNDKPSKELECED